DRDGLQEIALVLTQLPAGEGCSDLGSPTVAVLSLEFALRERTQTITEQIHRLADSFLVGDRHELFLGLAKECTLFDCRFGALAGEPDDLGPALDEAVIDERLRCALLPLAQGVKAVGQLAGYLGLGAEPGNHFGRCAFAASGEHAD